MRPLAPSLWAGHMKQRRLQLSVGSMFSMSGKSGLPWATSSGSMKEYEPGMK
jgi:hypothetical protein